jgi:hypothetical protein
MDDDVTRAWLAGAQAARASDVAALDRVGRAHAEGCEGDHCVVALRAALAAVTDAPLPAPPAPPQSPLPSPDGGTGPQGDGAPAGGLSVAGAYVDAAGVCEQRAQTQDRLAAASPPGERLSRAWAADELRYVADRIRALAGGP